MLQRRMLLVLNRDLHSPLTLAAAELDAVQGQELDAATEAAANKKVDMLAFLLNELKEVVWTYGPVKCSLVSLEGLDKPYNYKEYPDLAAEIDAELAAAKWASMWQRFWSCRALADIWQRKSKRVHCYDGSGGSDVDAAGVAAASSDNATAVNGATSDINAANTTSVANATDDTTGAIAAGGAGATSMTGATGSKVRQLHGVIDWICKVNSTKAIQLQDIRKVVETKWERVGQRHFLETMYLHCIVVCAFTILTLFPYMIPSYKHDASRGDKLAMIVYPILGAVMLYKFASDVMGLMKYGGRYFDDLRGAAKLEKYGRVYMLVCFAAMCALKIAIRHYSSGYITPWSDDVDVSLKQLMSASTFFTSIGTLTAWVSLFYFKMVRR